VRLLPANVEQPTARPLILCGIKAEKGAMVTKQMYYGKFSALSKTGV